MKKLLLLFLILPFLSHGQIIITLAGNGTGFHSGDGGPATAAGIFGPGGLAFDAAGNTYVAEYYGNTIRKIAPSGIITTVVGTGIPGYSGDGGPASAAQINAPTKIYLDATGNLFIADNFNNCIRKVSVLGIISTFAGTGIPGYSGDGGSATDATLYHPISIVQGPSGNFYISDYANYVIRCVSPAGIISTVAGNGIPGYSGDGGPATDASIHFTFGIAFDAAGNMYLGDGNNNCIRKVSPSGIITTFAGTGIAGYGGDGGPASAALMNNAVDIAIDSSGNFYIDDQLNYRIRKIDASGTITTVVGNGSAGFGGDGGPATTAMINQSNELTFNKSWRLVFTDNNNNRVREITDSGCIDHITTQPLNDSVFAGDTAKFNVLTSMPAPYYQWQEDAGTGFGSLINVWPYSGVNTNTLIIQATSHLLNATHYRCIITSESSPCADTSNPAILIIKSGVGVSDLPNSQVHIFPDPAHDYLTISIHGNTVAGNIQLSNELGQQILEQKLTGSIAELTISELPAGMYILRVSIGDLVIVRKVFKD